MNDLDKIRKMLDPTTLEWEVDQALRRDKPGQETEDTGQEGGTLRSDFDHFPSSQRRRMRNQDELKAHFFGQPFYETPYSRSVVA
jgi:hypothetical protein